MNPWVAAIVFLPFLALVGFLLVTRLRKLVPPRLAPSARVEKETLDPPSVLFSQSEVELMPYKMGVPGWAMRGQLIVTSTEARWVGNLGWTFLIRRDPSLWRGTFSSTREVGLVVRDGAVVLEQGARHFVVQGLDTQAFLAAFARCATR